MKRLWILILTALLPVGICSAAAVDKFTETVLIIDAGHGGPDGGAVSPEGVSESGINLAIAKKLESLCRMTGVPCLMTRKDENSVHSEGAKTIREMKVSDIRNRAELVNSVPDAFLLSIHQNSYGTKARGAQIFYRDGSEESRLLAETIRENINTVAGADRERPTARIPESVYLFKNTTCPAVLMECGFISNSEDAQLLRSGEYQSRLAVAAVAAFLAAYN